MVYDKHIFICTNQRSSGDRLSCGESHGIELVALFKKLINDNGLSKSMRAQKAGCLGICDFGPTIAVYPDGIFYVGVKLEDVPEIFNEHLLKGKPLERLMLKRSDV